LFRSELRRGIAYVWDLHRAGWARNSTDAHVRTVLAKEVTEYRSPLPVVSDLTLANVDY
jgi:hypothetical protein